MRRRGARSREGTPLTVIKVLREVVHANHGGNGLTAKHKGASGHQELPVALSKAHILHRGPGKAKAMNRR